MTATAVVGAIVAPTMAIMTRGVDRRYVMWAFSLALLLSNLIAAFATNFAMLLTARIILGVALGGFWSMAAAMAMRLVPMRLMPRAMSIILTGVSFATVSAAPIGAYIGDVWGWRTAFFSAAGVGLLALVAQLTTLPSLPPIGSPSLATLLALLKRPSLRLALFTVLLAVSGHFAGFTYIRPLLEEVPMLSVASISLVLLGFGIGGFFGNFAGAFLLERSLRVEVALGAFAIGLMAVLLILFGRLALARRYRRHHLGLRLQHVAGRPLDLDGACGARMKPKGRAVFSSPPSRSRSRPALCWAASSSTASVRLVPRPMPRSPHSSARRWCSPAAAMAGCRIVDRNHPSPLRGGYARRAGVGVGWCIRPPSVSPACSRGATFPARGKESLRRAVSARARLFQRLVEIGDDVVDMLQAHRQPHIAGRHAGGVLVFLAQLRMRRRGRMNGERARIADIGDMVEHLERVDETFARFHAARQLEADKSAAAALR